MINERGPREQSREGRGVNSSAPKPASKVVVVFGMFADEKRLGFAITNLLPQISPDVGPPIVPDEPSVAETNFETGILQPPAKIHIISGLAENWIEHSALLECGLTNGHVATGNVLGLTIRQEHMSRAAR